jgi:hypothetical protein
MAHYAYLNSHNVVVAVIVGKDETELIDGLDTETYYALNTPYTVKRTSYNAASNGFRYNYAGIGFTYDEIADAFIAPKPECGHDELQLTDNYQWSCNNSDHRPTWLVSEN